MTINENRPRCGKQQGGTQEQTQINRSTGRNDEQIIHSDDGRHVIGTVRGNVFHKSLSASKHMLRRPLGWANDALATESLASMGVTMIVVTDRDSGTVYSASLADFLRYGVRLYRGFGPQICLPLGYWSIDGTTPRIAPSEAPGTPSEVQLALF